MPSQAKESSRLRSQHKIAWLLFVAFQALYGLTSSGNVFRVPDEFEVYAQTEHLVDGGDLSVPGAVARGQFFGRVGADHKPYAPYGPLTAVLDVPHHLLARGVARLAGLSRDTETWRFVVSGLTSLASATAAALAVAGFYQVAVLVGAPPGTALLLAILLGAASPLWTYSATMYSEAWQAAILIWAAFFVLRGRSAPAAVLAAALVLTKITSVVFTPALVVMALADGAVPRDRRRQDAAMLLIGIAAALAVHVVWNVYRFGAPFEFGYDWAETVPVLPARAFSLAELPRGLAVLLVSPGKSLLIWAPPVWLSLSQLRRWRHPAVAGALTAGVLGLLVFGAYMFPEGGYAHGPRHLVPIVPLLLLPAALGTPKRTIWIPAAILGVGIACLSVSVSFLQDEALGRDLTRTGYYERIEPAPGRPWNRYNLAYVPFARTMSGPDWPRSSQVGLGLDWFWLHLERARTGVPEARAIPRWLPWALPLFWLALGITAVAALARERTAAVPGPGTFFDSV